MICYPSGLLQVNAVSRAQKSGARWASTNKPRRGGRGGREPKQDSPMFHCDKCGS